MKLTLQISIESDSHGKIAEVLTRINQIALESETKIKTYDIGFTNTEGK